MSNQAGVSMFIRPEGLDDTKRKLAALARLTAKPAKLMKAIGAFLESSTRNRFRTGVSPDGTPWKPSIRVLRKGGKTLVVSARLRDSITSDGDDTAAVVGSNLVYARVQQLGGVIKAKGGGYLKFQIPGIGWRQVRKVTLPARPFLGVSSDDRVGVADLVERYIARQAAA